MDWLQQKIVSTTAASMASQRAEQRKHPERTSSWRAKDRTQSKPASSKTHFVVQMFSPISQQSATEIGALAAIGTGTQTKQGIVTEPFTP